MDKLTKLRQLVEKQYNQKLPSRTPWSDWLYPNHVLSVAQKSEELCQRFGGKPEIAVAGALVHDIADSMTSRFSGDHEKKSLELGRDLLEKSGYSPQEISIIIDDIAVKHGCDNGIVPDSLEGKIVAAADALAHFQKNYFEHAFKHQGGGHNDPVEIKKWALKKIEHDFKDKITFDEIREEIRPRYEELKLLLSNRD